MPKKKVQDQIPRSAPVLPFFRNLRPSVSGSGVASAATAYAPAGGRKLKDRSGPNTLDCSTKCGLLLPIFLGFIFLALQHQLGQETPELVDDSEVKKQDGIKFSGNSNTKARPSAIVIAEYHAEITSLMLLQKIHQWRRPKVTCFLFEENSDYTEDRMIHELNESVHSRTQKIKNAHYFFEATKGPKDSRTRFLKDYLHSDTTIFDRATLKAIFQNLIQEKVLAITNPLDTFLMQFDQLKRDETLLKTLLHARQQGVKIYFIDSADLRKLIINDDRGVRTLKSISPAEQISIDRRRNVYMAQEIAKRIAAGDFCTVLVGAFHVIKELGEAFNLSGTSVFSQGHDSPSPLKPYDVMAIVTAEIQDWFERIGKGHASPFRSLHDRPVQLVQSEVYPPGYYVHNIKNDRDAVDAADEIRKLGFSA